MNNLELWRSLEKTDPAHTKPFTRGGGFRGTAINGTYIIKKLTEAFGPCGRGWRFVIDEEKIVSGHTLKNGDKAQLHIIRGHLEYMHDTQWRQTSPQFGQTMLVDENKNGVFTDEEAPKKSITDCIAKCAVMLGIAADVHLGMFDDNKYVNERKKEEAEAKKAEAGQPDGKGSQETKPGTNQAPPPDPSKREFAKSARQSIIDQVMKAKDGADIDAILDANKRNVEMLKTEWTLSYDKMMEIVAARRAALAKGGDLNDETGDLSP